MKKMSKGMLMTALICGAVYLGNTPVYASELQEFALDEYVVTAARTETKLVDTPANISVVDAQTIEERHYQDVSEVLKDVPGANVLDSGAGAFEKKIMLNGDERVLILVDGRRLNQDMGTMSRSSFDMNQLPDVSLIERVEVLKGAGGALYGSDAVGGVVNIITKKANKNFGKVSVAMGSMGAEDYSAMYSIKEGKTGVTVAASKYEQMLRVKPSEIDVYYVTQSGDIIDTVPDEVRLTWNRVKDSFLQSIAPSIDLDACIEKIQKNQLSLQASMVADDLDATRLWVGLPELEAEFSRRIGVVVESVVKFIVISRRKPSIGKSRYIITLNALTRDGKQSKAFPFSIGCLSLEPELKKLLPQSESICIKFKKSVLWVISVLSGIPILLKYFTLSIINLISSK